MTKRPEDALKPFIDALTSKRELYVDLALVAREYGFITAVDSYTGVPMWEKRKAELLDMLRQTVGKLEGVGAMRLIKAQERKLLWAKDPWKFTRSAITTLLSAADAILRHRQAEGRDNWFEESIGEVTGPLRAWWAQLKEDYDKNPKHRAAWRDENPDGALTDFYLECKVALVDPVVADEIRAEYMAEAEKARAYGHDLIADASKPGVYIGDGPPVRLQKPTETPDELVELAINRLVEACRQYWAEAKATGKT